MPLEAEVFCYLDRLRESGTINMLGATSYLMAEFGLEAEEARTWLQSWMDSKVND